MRDFFEDRALEEARFLIENNCTIREVATNFGISKSTVHKDLSKKLIDYDISTYEQVKIILDYNLSVRHIRGGESTKKHYEKSN